MIGAREVSRTFHGRDVFAPVGARALAWTIELTRSGQRVELAGELPWGPRPRATGRVVHIDHYGNLVTDLPAEEAGEAVDDRGRAGSRSRRPTRTSRRGELLAYVGSARTIEIAVRDGRADACSTRRAGRAIAPATT